MGSILSVSSMTSAPIFALFEYQVRVLARSLIIWLAQKVIVSKVACEGSLLNALINISYMFPIPLSMRDPVPSHQYSLQDISLTQRPRHAPTPPPCSATSFLSSTSTFLLNNCLNSGLMILSLDLSSSIPEMLVGRLRSVPLTAAELFGVLGDAGNFPSGFR